LTKECGGKKTVKSARRTAAIRRKDRKKGEGQGVDFGAEITAKKRTAKKELLQHVLSAGKTQSGITKGKVGSILSGTGSSILVFQARRFRRASNFERDVASFVNQKGA